MSRILDAFYELVHRRMPGGAEATAVRLRKSGTQLCHELRPPRDNKAKLGLLDAIEIMELGDTVPLPPIDCAPTSPPPGTPAGWPRSPRDKVPQRLPLRFTHRS